MQLATSRKLQSLITALCSCDCVWLNLVTALGSLPEFDQVCYALAVSSVMLSCLPATEDIATKLQLRPSARIMSMDASQGDAKRVLVQ